MYLATLPTGQLPIGAPTVDWFAVSVIQFVMWAVSIGLINEVNWFVCEFGWNCELYVGVGAHFEPRRLLNSWSPRDVQ